MQPKQPKIYIISGKAHRGKDTVKKFIYEFYQYSGKRCIDLTYASYIKQYAMKITDWDGSDNKKPRALLQQLGTEIIRRQIDEYFLINRIIDDIKVYSYFFDIIIISDARIKEELSIPKQEFWDVTTIRVERPNYKSTLTPSEQNHFTEIALDNYTDYNYIVNNDGSLNELKDKIFKILEEVSS